MNKKCEMTRKKQRKKEICINNNMNTQRKKDE